MHPHCPQLPSITLLHRLTPRMTGCPLVVSVVLLRPWPPDYRVGMMHSQRGNRGTPRPPRDQRGSASASGGMPRSSPDH